MGIASKTLILASMSANLTRSGWWENVESCHVEEITEGDKTRLLDDIASLLGDLRRKVTADSQHTAMNEIRTFLKTVTPRLRNPRLANCTLTYTWARVGPRLFRGHSRQVHLRHLPRIICLYSMMPKSADRWRTSSTGSSLRRCESSCRVPRLARYRATGSYTNGCVASQKLNGDNCPSRCFASGRRKRRGTFCPCQDLQILHPEPQTRILFRGVGEPDVTRPSGGWRS